MGRRTEMQRDAQENLWPKSFLERPVARHFVWRSLEHIACRSVSYSKHKVCVWARL